MAEILEAVLAFFTSIVMMIFDTSRYVYKYSKYREKQARDKMIKEYPQLKKMDE